MKRSPADGMVTGKDWMSLKPWDTFSDYDKYYVALANQVRKAVVFMTEGSKSKMNPKIANRASCILVSYFEDFINETGIWQVFAGKCMEITGKPIPFYDLEGYDSDYINAQDISYLLWHSLSQFNPEVYYAPDHEFIQLAGQNLFYLFEDEIEEAPATDFYTKYFKLEDGITWKEIEAKMHWFGQTGFLPGASDLEPKFKDYMADLVQRNQLPTTSNTAAKLLLFGQETFSTDSGSSFMGLTGLDFLLGTIQCSAKLRKSIKEASRSASGLFECTGETTSTFRLRYMGTELEVELPKTDLWGCEGEGAKYLLKIRIWHGEWRISSIPILQEESFEMGKGEQRIPFWLWSAEEQKALQELTRDSRTLFLERFAAPFVELESPDELEAYLNDVMESLNSVPGLKGLPNLARDFFLAGHEGMEGFLNDLVEKAGGKRFCISLRKDLGLAFGLGPTRVREKMESPELREADRDELFEELLAELEPELSIHCLNNFSQSNLRYPIPQCKLDVAKDHLAWLRFYQPSSFVDQLPRLRT